MRILTRVAVLCSAVALPACSQGLTVPSTDDLAAAPERVVVAGTTLRLETTLWRDFMPISPPDGQPLIGVFRVRTIDGSPIPEGLSIAAAHVVHDREVWSPAVEQEYPSERDDVLEVVGREGPKWGPGVEVDVIVRIRYAGNSVLLRALDQPIIGTS